MYTGYLLPLSVQSQSGVISAFPIFCDFRQPCISKMVGRRAKRTHISASGVVI